MCYKDGRKFKTWRLAAASLTGHVLSCQPSRAPRFSCLCPANVSRVSEEQINLGQSYIVLFSLRLGDVLRPGQNSELEISEMKGPSEEARLAGLMGFNTRCLGRLDWAASTSFQFSIVLRGAEERTPVVLATPIKRTVFPGRRSSEPAT